MAAAAEGATTAAGGEGPVLSMLSKRLRALRKKYNRILQMEERVAEGKPLNKEQEELLRSKSAVATLIEEHEHLRQPLSIAVQEEVSLACATSPSAPPAPEKEDEQKKDDSVDDLIELLYFGLLFDVKPHREYETTMLTRTHERGCCITYDTVTDDTTSLLEEGDLDMISALSNLVLSRPLNSSISHKSALQNCVQHAKLWLRKSDQPVLDGSSYTYAALREHLKKILASDYATATPEIKPSVDLAAEVGYATSQAQVSDFSLPPPVVIAESTTEHHQHENDDSEGKTDDQTQCNPVEGMGHESYDDALDHEVVTSVQQEVEKLHVNGENHAQRDAGTTEAQNVFRRVYQNHRGNNRGSGRRGYANGRGGRGGRGGGRFPNGRGQYYDPGYYPRNYYNTRGRGGRAGGAGPYNNHGAGPGGRAHDVELSAS